MAELARGTVGDRPWGRLLAALGLRGVTGQLALSDGGKVYAIVFDRGVIAGATSPQVNDAAVKVALTANLISSSQVADITRRIAAARGRDELEILAEAARLSPEHVGRLRRRLVAQRAARTFAIDRGEYVVEDRVTLPVVPGGELDVRTVVYYGAVQMMTEQRLVAELAQLGGWFRLKPEAEADLAQYGFGDPAREVIERLRAGESVDELVAALPSVGARNVYAIAYALAACGACDASSAPRAPALPRAHPTSTAPTELRREPVVSAARPSPPTTPYVGASSASAAAVTTRIPALARSRTRDASAARGPRDPAAAAETEALIKDKLQLLDRRADHFALLGVPFDAPLAAVRSGYFDLARKLHPDRLAALGIADDDRRAQRLFAEINTAFAVLADPARRGEYVSIMRRGGEAAVRAEQARADDLATRVMQAEEAFRRGELALKRDALAQAVAEFTTAVELQPNEPEYQALLAWARFAVAPDKAAIGNATRDALQRAAEAASQSPTPRYYLGRVERMLGRERQALQQFHEVLRIRPSHAEAASEARVLEQRLRIRR